MPIVVKLFRARIYNFKTVEVEKCLHLLAVNISLGKLAVCESGIS